MTVISNIIFIVATLNVIFCCGFSWVLLVLHLFGADINSMGFSTIMFKWFPYIVLSVVFMFLY